MLAATRKLWADQNRRDGGRSRLFPHFGETSVERLCSGTLVAAPSHGDVAMASIDPRYQLSGVLVSRSGDYRVRTENLEAYLVPRSPIEITPAMLPDRGRGVQDTKSPFAYLFRRVT